MTTQTVPLITLNNGVEHAGPRPRRLPEPARGDDRRGRGRGRERLPTRRHRRRLRQRARGRRGHPPLRHRPLRDLRHDEAVDQRLRLRAGARRASTAACAGSASTTSTSSCSTSRCRATSTRTVAAYKAAEQMLADGRARAIGVSNFSARHLESLIGRTRSCRRSTRSSCTRSSPSERCATSTPRTASSPRRGRRSAASTGTAPPTPTRSRTRSSTRRSSSSPRSTARRPLRSCSAGTSSTASRAIPKSVKPHRIAENFDIFDFALTPDEVAAIDALDTGMRGGPDPELVDTKLYPFKVEN